ncbi:MAG TPA: metallophosphoesterase [Chthoniobacterales bacterium]
MSHLTRRQFLTLTGLALPAAVIIDTRLVEPTNLRVAYFPANTDGALRFIHFSDFHHKGNAAYAEKVITTINNLEADFVCFTGDLIEEIKHLDEALHFIGQIKKPVYGCPGNHDYNCRAPFAEYERVFAATGGRWLVGQTVVLPEHDLELTGMSLEGVPMAQPRTVARRFLLTHYPKSIDHLDGHHYDWIMAGHSHGWQIRIPGYGPIALPYGVGPYDLGFFLTDKGPMYVNAGIGTYRIPWRFNCRPEITVVTI